LGARGQGHGGRRTTLPLIGRFQELLLVVDEGDNTPLPVTAARLLPAHRLRFFRERNAPLRFVYGNVNMTPPRYDPRCSRRKCWAWLRRIAVGDEQSASAAASLRPLFHLDCSGLSLSWPSLCCWD
jgi:hypothetical protein